MSLSLLSIDPISSPSSQGCQWDQSVCLRAHYTRLDKGRGVCLRGPVMSSDAQSVTVCFVITLLIFVNVWLLLQLFSR